MADAIVVVVGMVVAFGLGYMTRHLGRRLGGDHGGA